MVGQSAFQVISVSLDRRRSPHLPVNRSRRIRDTPVPLAAIEKRPDFVQQRLSPLL